MTTYICREVQNIMAWTNEQSELESRCSGIMTKKSKRKNMQKLTV